MSQNNLQDTAPVMIDLQRSFAEPTDVANVVDITKKSAEIEKLQIKRQTDAKKLLKELSQRNEQLSSELSRKDNTDEYRTRLEALERQKENLGANVATYDKQLCQLRLEIDDLKRRTDELKQRRSQLQSQRLDDAPRLKLYQCISNIKWDYDAPARVKGHVDIVDHKRQIVKDIRPFDFDPAQLTPFEITSKLWDLME